MSYTPHDAIDVIPEAGIGGHRYYSPQSAPVQAPQGVSNFSDGSGDIFSMYLKMASEEDKKMVENWKADADGILIFTGLFSAAVASLISVSVQDIRPNSQDTSNFYLANIYQVIANPNQANIYLPSSPPPFSPPNYAIWVNALWFLSLGISLTCDLLATLLQQWARRYLKATQSRYAPHKRARIRAFLAEGVKKHLLPWTVETLPTLLHISLFLFFAGLVVFLWNVDLTIFKLLLSWVGVCTALYGCITVMPIIHHDSPYHTPLSFPAWHIVSGIQFLTFRALRRLALLDCFSAETYDCFQHLAEKYGQWLVQGMQKTVEETALNSPSAIDTRAFLWTFDCLDEDHELEHFFSGIPGFRSSKVVDDPFPTLAEEGNQRLFTALTGLLDCSFSSDLLPEAVKKRRAIICTKVADPAHIPEALNVLNTILSKYPYSDPLVAEMVRIVRGWEIDTDGDAILYAIARFSTIIARVQPHDDTWFILASESMDLPEAVLRDYAAHGDGLSLAVLIHVVRLQFRHFRKQSWPFVEFSKVLEEVSTFNVQDTLPELQHEFCALWNQIARKVQDDDSWSMAFYILGRIRNVYIALHRDTNSTPTGLSASTTDYALIRMQPSSYSLCNIPGHHPDSTNNVYDNSASTAFAHAVLHDHGNTTPVPSFLSGSPYAPSSSAHPFHVDERLKEAPPRNNNISSSVSLQHIDQTTTESRRTPPTSPNPVITRTTRGGVDAIHLSTPEPSASTPHPKSRASASSPDTVDVEYSADTRAPSHLSLTHPLNSMVPTKVHSSMLASGAPDPANPWLSFAAEG